MDEINFWPRVIEFIRQRDPVFLSKIEGVPDDAISALMTKYSITLPAAYIMFLQLMGTNSNGFNLFGPTQDHHFSTIVKRMNDYREATGQFFPVAIETGKSEEVMHDYYLDLLHSDGKDAPLQRFEQIIPVDEDSLLETSETFCERIISSVSYYFGLRSLAAQSVIRMQEPGAYQEVLSLLLSMGLMSTLPMLERVSCLKGGPLLILVEVDDIGGMLTLTFGSNDPKAVKTLSKQLLSNPLTKLK